MSSPMTLREALGIVLKSCGEFTNFPDSKEDIERANAIVDAAVEFVEAEEAHSRTLQASWRGKASGNSVADTWSVKNQSIDKLRALERGEGSEVQP